MAETDHWIFRPTSVLDPLFTRALQQSLSSSSAVAATTPSDTTHLTPTSGLTSQGVEAPTKKQWNRNGGAPRVSSGKVAKRKSRSTKRSQTTFIAADAGNFRQMVQQVTGSRLGYSPSPTVNIGQILRPVPHRPGNWFPGIAGCLPKLDTSAILLDCHHNQQQEELEFDPFVSFPTLDSWSSI